MSTLPFSSPPASALDSVSTTIMHGGAPHVCSISAHSSNRPARSAAGSSRLTGDGLTANCTSSKLYCLRSAITRLLNAFPPSVARYNTGPPRVLQPCQSIFAATVNAMSSAKNDLPTLLGPYSTDICPAPSQFLTRYADFNIGWASLAQNISLRLARSVASPI